MLNFFKNLGGHVSNFFGKIKDKAISTFHDLKNKIKERGTTLLTGTHYVGPFNDLSDEYVRTHPPTDKIDEGGFTVRKTGKSFLWKKSHTFGTSDSSPADMAHHTFLCHTMSFCPTIEGFDPRFATKIICKPLSVCWYFFFRASRRSVFEI